MSTKNQTRHQLIDEMIHQGQCGLLAIDFSAPCSKRDGPERPDERHPGRIGFLTCNGCAHNAGPWYFQQVVCTHRGARQVASQCTADALRRWEEVQKQKAQLTLF